MREFGMQRMFPRVLDMRANNPKLTGERVHTYFEIAKQSNGFAREIGKPLSQIAINWLIKQEAVTSVIYGAQTTQHVEENVGSVEWELTDDMLTWIEDIVTSFSIV